MIRNRKGQIPLLLSVPVALAIAIVALMSFASFNNKFGSGSIDNSQMVSSVNFGEQYVVELSKAAVKEVIGTGNVIDLKSRFNETVLKKNVGIKEAGNFFIKVDEGAFKLESTKESGYHNYRLIIAGLVAESGAGESKIIRKFDLCLEFDLNGNYLKRCKVTA